MNDHDHDHDDHAHEEHAAPPPATEGVAALSGRLVLTVVGAAAMIVGAFLDWVSEGAAKGTEIGIDVFWTTDASGDPSFLASAGFAVIVIGLITLVGAAMASGWLSRLGGALGVVAFILFVITLYRVQEADLSIADVGIGMWIVLAGAVVALVGGFFGTRRVG